MPSEAATESASFSPGFQPITSKTAWLLLCGVFAGPLYIVLGLIQMLIRQGFDPTRHALSLMSNGELGWIQIANFVATGVLVVAASIGMRQALRRGRGGIWGPLLIGIYGLGLIGAGIFVADPALGFPPGTPPGRPVIVTRHGILHFVSGGLGFFGLIAACFVFARRFAQLKKPGWAAYSVATGLLFGAAFFGVASGSTKPWIIIAFTVAVVWAWLWISAVAAQLMIVQRNVNAKQSA
jgi:hypothetical protein